MFVDHGVLSGSGRPYPQLDGVVREVPSLNSQAKAHWKKCVRRWRSQRQSLVHAVERIDEPNLQLTAARMIQALEADQGAFITESGAKDRTRIVHIDLDDEPLDAVLAELAERGVDDPEAMVEDSSHWLLSTLLRMDVSIAFLGWTFGSIVFDDDPKSGKFNVSDGGVVYRHGSIKGMMVLDHGKNRLVSIEKLTK